TRRGPDLRRVIVSIVVDRAGGLIGLIGIAWLALLLEPAAAPSHTRAMLGWTTLVLALGPALAAVIALRGGAARRLVPGALLTAARDTRDILREYARSPTLLAWLFA